MGRAGAAVLDGDKSYQIIGQDENDVGLFLGPARRAVNRHQNREPRPAGRQRLRGWLATVI